MAGGPLSKTENISLANSIQQVVASSESHDSVAWVLVAPDGRSVIGLAAEGP